MSGERFFEGLVVGGILGFLFGMLVAPKSGAELRQQLADGGEDLYKSASDSLSGIKDKTNAAITDIQSKGGEVMKKATDAKDQIAHKLQEMAGQSTQVLVDDVETATSGG